MKSAQKLLFIPFFSFLILWPAYNSNISKEYDSNIEANPVLQLIPPKNQWIEFEQGMRYRYADGSYAKGWLLIDDEHYYINPQGYKVTGWYIINLERYYFDENGVMAKNKWFQGSYLNEQGIMLRNALTPDLKYVDETGKINHTYAGWDASKEGLKDLKDSLAQIMDAYRGTWAIYVKNLDTNEYLAINNTQIYSASLIKLFCMMTVYEQLEDGRITMDAKLERRLDSMITVSSNDTFNELVIFLGNGSHMAGREIINEYCQRNEYYDTIVTSTLQPSYVKAPASPGRNMTTVMDCGMGLERIYRSSCVSRRASQEMLELLLAQKKLYKIPAGLPEGTKSASKTGETSEVEHDAAIVYSDGANYIICIMSSHCGAAPIYIRNLSKMVYEYFNSYDFTCLQE